MKWLTSATIASAPIFPAILGVSDEMSSLILQIVVLLLAYFTGKHRPKV
jgi:hypothetical protein